MVTIDFNCEGCVSCDVCKYKDKHIDEIHSENPFVKIICTKFAPKNILKSKIKDCQLVISEWRKANPKGRKIDCERELGLSRPTILKYWDMREVEE